jgi:uracil-DNA glycosylase
LRKVLEPFAAWAGPRRPKMLLVGEAWGREEEKVRKPFVGESGKELWRMLGEALPDLLPQEHSRVCDLHRFDLAWVPHREPWLEAASIGMTNVFNLRPQDNKIETICISKKDLPINYDLPALMRAMYCRPEYLAELDRLESEVREANPNIIVAMGNTACWALLRATNISGIRGTVTRSITGHKCLPTFHPAGVLYQWSWRPIVVADLMKSARESNFSELHRPRRELLISPTIEEWISWTNQTLARPPRWLANDLETTAGLIDTVGFATSSSSGIVCMVGPHRVKIGSGFRYIWPTRDGQPSPSYWSHNEERVFWDCCFRLLASPIPKLFQNGMYDLQYWLRMGARPEAVLEDTMLAHHSLFPEMQKSLGFLGSIYTDESSWKLLRRHKNDSEKRDE